MVIMRVGLAAGVVASGLLLSGCAGAPSGSVPVTTSSAPTSSAAPTSSSPSAGGSDQAQGDSGSGSGATVRGCTLDRLGAALGSTTGEAGQRHTTVIWTNTSSSTCTMTGFGGVDLHGPADPMGTTYSLPRSSKKPTKVTLAPGGKAHTTITWLPPQDGSGWTPTQIVITPPDEVSSAALQWPGGAVLRQDAATHPGTFIDPVAPGTGG